MHAGAGAYDLRRGDRAARLAGGLPRPAQAEAAVPRDGRACTPARPWSTTSSRSPACRTSCSHGAGGLRALGTEKSKGFGIFSLSGHVTDARPVRGPARHHAARAARPGRRHPGRAPAEVLDPRRIVHADLHRRAPGRAARLRVRRRRRVHARHQGAADLRRDHLRGPRRAALDRVLRARVLRQVHAVPRGHATGSSSCSTRWSAAQGSEADLDKLLDICDNILGRAFCAARRRSRSARSSRRSSTSGTSSSSTKRTAAARSTRPASALFDGPGVPAR